jgi:hypothetical protein
VNVRGGRTDFSEKCGGHVNDRSPVNPTHQWFTALDQRLLSIDAERWLTQVVGIHQDGSDIWIQLQPLREQVRDFTVRVRPGMSVDDVVTAVAAQIRDVSRRAR